MEVYGWLLVDGADGDTAASLLSDQRLWVQLSMHSVEST